jgi:hypothetical protein
LLAFVDELCAFELLSVNAFIHPVVLRRVFKMKWNEIICGWRELYDEELHNFLLLARDN